MNKKILHIAYNDDKFMPQFIEFVKLHFDFNEHEFLLTGRMVQDKIKRYPNIQLAERSIPGYFKHYGKSIIKMHQAQKVILHGMFDIKLVYILFFMPWLLKKCYWFIWGGDLYEYKLRETNFRWKLLDDIVRRPVIKNIGHLITYIKGDYELAKQWYSAKGKYHECIMYTSNLYREYEIPQKQNSCVNILVGNSADPSNNHIDAFDKLEALSGKDIKIYVPLSYGNPDYAKMIIEQGHRRFGEKFEALTEYMPFNKYLEFLGKIDIAIFNHKRQQAMGNTITLLGLGKKVFMRRDVTPWAFFKSNGITVYDIKDLSLFDSANREIEANKHIVKSYFSEKTFLNQLREIFN
ncbi:TDP-N-acetylfucosamine:lipid II N-acetylfucosaminyltransferase [Rheinheimera sp. UJ63]|uniref:TDP-N-acetylfucosamine:lipid II N-acetylfucosaminyltransferase n=1 Tax=Rheinheimera sp. UJ63 TaxID=2910157 RepID=UPI001F3005EE|nr:TDP-N-acetylfucosamine:lipid II N-acetylfucosaminyltransferase [Rheinheimera sp. UJ63]MCF4009277.1 TDP-N-acetylfucosamine:lipid II N-acetylfucosaminyltransferase [Rheinheimera sp. UJ63]